VNRNGTFGELQSFRIDRTGSRKYSVPRLASARGEEAARRAMPTSWVLGFVLPSGTGGGAEAGYKGSQVPWRAAVGNKVRLVPFARFRIRVSGPGDARRMGEVAIVCLAAQEKTIFAFCSLCQQESFALVSPMAKAHMIRSLTVNPPSGQHPFAVGAITLVLNWSSCVLVLAEWRWLKSES
jgi:hypothetical protein